MSPAVVVPVEVAHDFLAGVGVVAEPLLVEQLVFGLAGLDGARDSPGSVVDVVHPLTFAILTDRSGNFDWSPLALQSLSAITGTDLVGQDQMVGYSILAARLRRHLEN